MVMRLPRNRRLKSRRLLRGLAFAVLAWLGASAGAILALRWVEPPFTAVMLLQPGPVGDLKHRWVPRAEIAGSAARAVIAAEDQRFVEHHGIDFNSLNQALADYREGEGLRGASTITQQVAKNLFLWQGRSVVRKALEAWFAVLIESLWTKERILEVYLNVAEFGPGIFGVEAAAREHFDLSAAALSVAEAALLAAVLPNPTRLDASRPSTYVLERQVWIVDQIGLLETRGHYRGLAW
jgi:monofunctional biosynthetic peptidoglycan transglycosylase